MNSSDLFRGKPECEVAAMRGAAMLADKVRQCSEYQMSSLTRHSYISKGFNNEKNIFHYDNSDYATAPLIEADDQRPTWFLFFMLIAAFSRQGWILLKLFIPRDAKSNNIRMGQERNANKYYSKGLFAEIFLGDQEKQNNLSSDHFKFGLEWVLNELCEASDRYLMCTAEDFKNGMSNKSLDPLLYLIRHLDSNSSVQDDEALDVAGLEHRLFSSPVYIDDVCSGSRYTHIAKALKQIRDSRALLNNRPVLSESIAEVNEWVKQNLNPEELDTVRSSSTSVWLNTLPTDFSKIEIESLQGRPSLDEALKAILQKPVCPRAHSRQVKSVNKKVSNKVPSGRRAITPDDLREGIAKELETDSLEFAVFQKLLAGTSFLELRDHPAAWCNPRFRVPSVVWLRVKNRLHEWETYLKSGKIPGRKYVDEGILWEIPNDPSRKSQVEWPLIRQVRESLSNTLAKGNDPLQLCDEKSPEYVVLIAALLCILGEDLCARMFKIYDENKNRQSIT
ncbi:MAG: hypothetical protein R3C11_01330 [Planctomycetaceae bacterium]